MQCRLPATVRVPSNIGRKKSMANTSDRFHLNVPGAWYNDNSCIDCGLCPELAPGIFRRHDASGQTFVWRQPVTEVEWAIAREAQEACPTESIGSDGEHL
jgi:ferredoxin